MVHAEPPLGAAPPATGGEQEQQTMAVRGADCERTAEYKKLMAVSPPPVCVAPILAPELARVLQNLLERLVHPLAHLRYSRGRSPPIIPVFRPSFPRVPPGMHAIHLYNVT